VVRADPDGPLGGRKSWFQRNDAPQPVHRTAVSIPDPERLLCLRLTPLTRVASVASLIVVAAAVAVAASLALLLAADPGAANVPSD